MEQQTIAIILGSVGTALAVISALVSLAGGFEDVVMIGGHSGSASLIGLVLMILGAALFVAAAIIVAVP